MPKIFQAGYMSGDTYSASAYLAVEPTARILLIKDTKEPQDKTDKVVYSFYRECGLIDRVSLLDWSSSPFAVKDLWKAFNNAPNSPPRKVAYSGGAPKTIEEALSYLYYSEAPQNEWPRSIVSVTGFVAEKFRNNSDEIAKTIAELWKIGKLDTDTKFALYEFAGNKFRKTGFDIRKNILVLWSRQSGKKGGAHFELDSSYQGIRQLVNYFAPAKATVLLAGDKRDEKLNEISTGYAQAIDISEMWKDPFWGKHFADIPVLAQLAFFKFLAEDYNVVHLGMRSGMLETMGLLGMPTFYMEPTACPSGSRMLAFARSGIPYSRIQIKEPPGLTARAGQLAIEKGVAAPSLDIVRETVNRNATGVKKFVPFQKSYGYYDRRTKTTLFDDDGEYAAESYGKAKALGMQDSVDIKGGTVIRNTRSLRGFLRSDFDTIAERIEGAFKS